MDTSGIELPADRHSDLPVYINRIHTGMEKKYVFSSISVCLWFEHVLFTFRNSKYGFPFSFHYINGSIIGFTIVRNLKFQPSKFEAF